MPRIISIFKPLRLKIKTELLSTRRYHIFRPLQIYPDLVLTITATISTMLINEDLKSAGSYIGMVVQITITPKDQLTE